MYSTKLDDHYNQAVHIKCVQTYTFIISCQPLGDSPQSSLRVVGAPPRDNSLVN